MPGSVSPLLGKYGSQMRCGFLKLRRTVSFKILDLGLSLDLVLLLFKFSYVRQLARTTSVEEWLSSLSWEERLDFFPD